MEFDEICRRIPHRPPFLWVDRVISLSGEEIVAEKFIPDDLEMFKGHYPDYPLMPGVLLCEAVFQAGALLISELMDKESAAGVPILTRIYKANFKRQVRPGSTIRMRVKLLERLGAAWIMRGRVLLGEKTALLVEFGCR
ncbi:MAG TPA: beta-hydroxyacyl-ACP dehydratase [Desulfobacterales bacterium]|nr:beta-hydroxyacyl-ACP dehydratase [Desulfobacterales bacterium]